MTCSRSAHWSLPDQSRVSSVAAGIVAVALLSRSSSHTTMERKNGSIKLLLAPMIPDSSIQMLNTAGMRRHAVPKGNNALIEDGARAHIGVLRAEVRSLLEAGRCCYRAGPCADASEPDRAGLCQDRLNDGLEVPDAVFASFCFAVSELLMSGP